MIDFFKMLNFMRIVIAVSLLCCTVFLSACGTVGAVSTVAKVANFTLETMGLKAPSAPDLPDSQMPPRNVAVKLHAGSNLNSGATGKPLSLITRIYKLKQTGAFYSAPYSVFLSPEKEKEALGGDLIEVRELNILPGQLYEVTEKVTREANFIGIVTLFRDPKPQRWRAAFAAKEAENSGIIVGLHACSLTVGKGAIADQSNLLPAANTPSSCQ